MYGPLTSRRRHHALKMRRELKNDGAIVAGFVKYPARLMVKTNFNQEAYFEHSDYSKMEVVFDNNSPSDELD